MTYLFQEVVVKAKIHYLQQCLAYNYYSIIIYVRRTGSTDFRFDSYFEVKQKSVGKAHNKIEDFNVM
jgi:hypothetical protein